MAGTGAATARAGWYPGPDDVELARYWDGTSWTDHRAPRASVAELAPVGWVWRLVVLSILPWLAFDLVLMLAPVWAADASYSFGGVIVVGAPLLVFVGGPGVVLWMAVVAVPLFIAAVVADGWMRHRLTVRRALH